MGTFRQNAINMSRIAIYAFKQETI